MKNKTITKQIAVPLPTHYWVVMRIERWDNMKLEQVGYKLPFPIQFIQPDNGEVGFLPVFDSKENALKYCNDERYITEVTTEF